MLTPRKPIDNPISACMVCGVLTAVWALYGVRVQILSLYHDPKLQTSRTAPTHRANETRMKAHIRCKRILKITFEHSIITIIYYYISTCSYNYIIIVLRICAFCNQYHSIHSCYTFYTLLHMLTQSW